MIGAFSPYDMLPVADEALDLGGVELLRAGLADKRLFVSLHRHAIETPDRWGNVLAEITLNLASLYAANGNFTENEVIAEVAAVYRDALRKYLGSAPAARAKPGKTRPVKSARPLGKTPAKKAKVLAKSKAKVKTPAKAKARPATKSKSASKAVAGRKGARG